MKPYIVHEKKVLIEFNNTSYNFNKIELLYETYALGFTKINNKSIYLILSFNYFPKCMSYRGINNVV